MYFYFWRPFLLIYTYQARIDVLLDTFTMKGTTFATAQTMHTGIRESDQGGSQD